MLHTKNIYFYLLFVQRGNETVEFFTLSIGYMKFFLPEAYLLNIMSENVRK
jgi:hypothetical protein